MGGGLPSYRKIIVSRGPQVVQDRLFTTTTPGGIIIIIICQNFIIYLYNIFLLILFFLLKVPVTTSRWLEIYHKNTNFLNTELTLWRFQDIHVIHYSSTFLTLLQNLLHPCIVCSRVSFGSHHGSMVETMIIEEMPSEEKSFYKDNILQEATQEWPPPHDKDA